MIGYVSIGDELTNELTVCGLLERAPGLEKVCGSGADAWNLSASPKERT